MFYEWQQKGTYKQPFAFMMKKNPLFAFAGLCERGKDKSSFLIITTQANDVVSPIHKRMPVILHKHVEDAWLDSSTSIERLQLLSSPYPAQDMKAYPVSDLVNKASAVNDIPQAAAPLEAFQYGFNDKQRQNKKLPLNHPRR